MNTPGIPDKFDGTFPEQDPAASLRSVSEQADSSAAEAMRLQAERIEFEARYAQLRLTYFGIVKTIFVAMIISAIVVAFAPTTQTGGAQVMAVAFIVVILVIMTFGFMALAAMAISRQWNNAVDLCAVANASALAIAALPYHMVADVSMPKMLFVMLCGTSVAGIVMMFFDPDWTKKRTWLFGVPTLALVYLAMNLILNDSALASVGVHPMNTTEWTFLVIMSFSMLYSIGRATSKAYGEWAIADTIYSTFGFRFISDVLFRRNK